VRLVAPSLQMMFREGWTKSHLVQCGEAMSVRPNERRLRYDRIPIHLVFDRCSLAHEVRAGKRLRRGCPDNGAAASCASSLTRSPELAYFASRPSATARLDHRCAPLDHLCAPLDHRCAPHTAVECADGVSCKTHGLMGLFD
jgi:hypothetical protein